MSKQLSRGTKRICQSATCALPFYDLNRADIHCPNCGTVFDTSVELYPRRDQIAAAPWESGGRTARSSAAITAAAEAKPSSPQLDEDDEAGSSTDEVIDADADTLPMEEDADDEIADVVVPPEDDQADR